MKRHAQPLLALLLCLSLMATLPGPGLFAQTKQEARAIRTTARLVQVSVIVRDKKGAPVTDLKPDDFTLLDNGQPQPISAFSLEVVRSEGSAAPVPAKPLPPNTFTNRQRGGATPVSVTVILFDALNTRASDQVYGKKQVARFLSGLRPHDRVALYGLSGGGIRVLHDFTADAAPLLAALSRYRAREERNLANTGPKPLDSGMALFEAQFENILKTQENFYVRDRAMRTVDALIAIANHLAAIPGRKNLVWVSGSFPISLGFDRLNATEAGSFGAAESRFASTSAQLSGSSEPAKRGAAPEEGSASGPAPIGDPDLMKPPEQGLFMMELERAARALNQAGMAIYPVDARGLVAAPPSTAFNPAAAAKNQGPTMTQWAGVDRQTLDVMNLLADRTGGRAFYNTNDIQGAIRRAIDDSQVSYVLGFYPTHEEWTGKYHKLKVQMTRPRLNARYRQGYFALPEPSFNENEAERMMKATAWNPLDATGLRVAVRAWQFYVAGADRIKLELHFVPQDVRLIKRDGQYVGALELVFSQRTGNGKVYSTRVYRQGLKISEQGYERIMTEGMTLSRDFDLLRDAELVMVVVRDPESGQMGSVRIPLDKLPPEGPG